MHDIRLAVEVSLNAAGYGLLPASSIFLAHGRKVWVPPQA
jgi:hypothetical protein